MFSVLKGACITKATRCNKGEYNTVLDALYSFSCSSYQATTESSPVRAGVYVTRKGSGPWAGPGSGFRDGPIPCDALVLSLGSLAIIEQTLCYFEVAL